MDTSLKQDIYEHFALVSTGAAGRELTGETVVPDSMPDVGTVVDAQAVLCVRGKEPGGDGVSMSGTVSVFVLYAPEDGGALRCVETELPAEIRVDAPGADEDCRAYADMRLISVEARAVNSRKLAVRAEVSAEAQCWRRENSAFASGLSGDDGLAHILMRESEVTAVSDVREKTFVVTDELAVPAGLSGGVRVLSRRVGASVDDVKYVTGKAIFRGRASMELLFSDDSGMTRPAKYETEFSQIMEIDCDAEEAFSTISLMLTGAYFDMPEYGEGTGRVQAELHFAAQCLCRRRMRISYMADIYANRTLLTPEFTETAAVLDARPVAMRQTVAGRAEPAGEGEAFILSAAVGAVSVEDGAVKTSVLIRLVTRSADGTYTPSKCRLSAEFTLPELTQGARLTEVNVTAADVYSAGSDVRAVLQMDAVAVTDGVIRSVSAVTEDAEGFAAMPKTPSVTLVRVREGAELWELARRCGSSPEAIAAANAGRQDGLLLIPKSR